MGNGTPAISLGERHGLILASDGSLWSWGSDFLGWPVLGLGNVAPQTRLRRVGNETNWSQYFRWDIAQCGHQIGWHAVDLGRRLFGSVWRGDQWIEGR